MQDSIAPVDDVAFSGNKNVLALGQEYLLRLPGPIGKAKKLERDRRRGLNWRRLAYAASRLIRAVSLGWFDGHRPHDENVSTIARVLDFLALAEQLQVERRIQARLGHRDHFSRRGGPP